MPLRTDLRFRAAFVLAASLVGAGVISGQAVAVSTAPRMIAKPTSAMVNTKIELSGRGFAAHTKLTIKECSSTGWVVVAQRPCNADNVIAVVTDARGRFARKFKVDVCPHASVSGPVTRRTCYIGNPQPRGVDTMALVGAVRITVTYP